MGRETNFYVDRGSKMLRQEGYNFMGACFEVYNTLGHGLYEEVYQQSLEIELKF